jgi:hypothetical protein
MPTATTGGAGLAAGQILHTLDALTYNPLEYQPFANHHQAPGQHPQALLPI